jgi:hypothetical protein
MVSKVRLQRALGTYIRPRGHQYDAPIVSSGMRIEVMLPERLITRSTLDVYYDNRHLTLLQLVVGSRYAIHVDVFGAGYICQTNAILQKIAINVVPIMRS